MKKVLAAVLMIMLCAGLAGLACYAVFSKKEAGPALKPGGERTAGISSLHVKIDENTKIVYVPAVATCEKLGLKTSWDGQKNALNVFLDSYQLLMPLEENKVTINGREEMWPAGLKMAEDILYMPLLPVIKELSALVYTDEAGGLCLIDPKELFDPPKPENASDETSSPGQGPKLHVAYPPAKNPFYYYSEALFVFGTTEPFIDAVVTVNGEPAELYDARSGNFLTMVEIPRGEEFLLKVRATKNGASSTVERKVLFPHWWEAMDEDTLAIHPSRVLPAARQVLSATEDLQVVFQGTPGAAAFFKVGEKGAWHKMQEHAYPGGPAGAGGVYKASLNAVELGLTASVYDQALPVTTKLEKKGAEIYRTCRGQAIFLSSDPYKIIEIKPEPELKNKGWLYQVNLNGLELTSASLGGAGYPTSAVSYLKEGTRYRACGACGDYYRVVLEAGENFLIHQSVAEELALKELAPLVVEGLEVKEDEKMVEVRFLTNERFHYTLEDGLKSLGFNLLKGTLSGDFVLPENSGAVKSISFAPGSAPGAEGLHFNLEVDFLLTGFKTFWEENTLVAELYKPVGQNRASPLLGKLVIVDPGHGGSDIGAPGPGKLDEKEVTLLISLQLKRLLEEEGAKVILTREEDIEVNLYERPLNIDSLGADLLISIHANAHAGGAPATKIRGIMVLYNYAHNEKLAEQMLETVAKETGLPKFRTWRRNIAVIRHPNVPTVLVEAGYMMHPADNWYLYHPQGQKIIAQALKSGIKNYFLTL